MNQLAMVHEDRECTVVLRSIVILARPPDVKKSPYFCMRCVHAAFDVSGYGLHCLARRVGFKRYSRFC